MLERLRTLPVTLFVAILVMLTIMNRHAASEQPNKPPFKNSVASNDLDFIKSTDPSVEFCIAFIERGRAEMPDKRGGPLHSEDVSMFEVRYADGTSFGLWVHPKLSQNADAKFYMQRVSKTASHLPSEMRDTLNRIVFHYRNETAFAEDKGHFFVMYHKNIDKRLRNHD